MVRLTANPRAIVTNTGLLILRTGQKVRKERKSERNEPSDINAERRSSSSNPGEIHPRVARETVHADEETIWDEKVRR
jgi:hypothetical protein